MTTSLQTDVLVIGAGPAGSMAATTLVRQGHRVLCVERDYFPRYVIGESLLPRVNELLKTVDLLPAVEARGYLPKHGAVFLSGETSERFCFAEALKGDYPHSFQVPRDDFDQTLATAARRQGVDLRFGHELQSLTLEPHGATATVWDHNTHQPLEIGASFVLDCSGYGRVLPRLLKLEAPSSMPRRVACFAQWEGDLRPSGEHEGDIWVCIHPHNGWIWHIPFSNGRTSVGMVCDPHHWETYTGPPPTRLLAYLNEEPNTAHRLRNAVPVTPTRVIEGYAKKVTRLFGERWAVAGNAADFLDPVFSSGVALAVESAHLAGTLVDRQLRGERVDWDTAYAAVLTQAIEVYRAFVESWYQGELPSIFFSNVKLPRVKRRITSILGGYVLRPDNPIAQDPAASLRQLASWL